MTVLEKYNLALDVQAARMREAAAQAREAGDQRQRSIRLMQASMLGDMLKQLGRVEHEKIRTGLMEAEVALMYSQAEAARKRDDYDEEDRSRVKGDTIRWALETLRKLEAENE